MFFYNTDLVNNAKLFKMYNSTALKSSHEGMLHYNNDVVSLEFEVASDALFSVFLYHNTCVVGWLKRPLLPQTVLFKH